MTTFENLHSKNSINGKDARASSIGSSARTWAKKHCQWARFTTRLIDDHTVRCWREV